MPRTTNPNFMAGVPELMILRLLHEHDMYGYQLVQTIRTETGDVVSLGEGVIYTVLHALERERAVKSRRRMVDGRSRNYYSVTATGERRYADLAKNWNALAAAIQSVMKGERHVPVT
jgi:PadR family transcriptional regulator, regulatory protein PadR